MAVLRKFLKHGEGRVSIEYALLIAFVALASADFYLSLGRNVSRIWSIAGSRLETANTSGRLHRSNSHNATQSKIEASGSTSSRSRNLTAQPSPDDVLPHD
jgi:Flp pilus assembly pilin Flp